MSRSFWAVTVLGSTVQIVSYHLLGTSENMVLVVRSGLIFFLLFVWKIDDNSPSFWDTDSSQSSKLHHNSSGRHIASSSWGFGDGEKGGGERDRGTEGGGEVGKDSALGILRRTLGDCLCLIIFPSPCLFLWFPFLAFPCPSFTYLPLLPPVKTDRKGVVSFP